MQRACSLATQLQQGRGEEKQTDHGKGACTHEGSIHK